MGQNSMALANSAPSLNQTRGAQAAHDLQQQAKGGDRAKIEKSARDFESILVGKWLEDAEKTFATVPGGDPDEKQDAGHDQYQSLAIQSLASNLTKSGGLGIAAMIVKNLESAKASGDEAPEPAKK